MIPIGLLGATGRMGKEVRGLVEGELHDRFMISATAGKDGDLSTLLRSEICIDFSTPEAMAALAEQAINSSAKLPVFVVGSTGWKLDGKKKLDALAEKTPVLMSSNFSLGMQALIQIIKRETPLFDKLGFSPVIVETHHKQKKDMPSGTALSLQSAIAPAGPGNITTHCIRAGDVIGEHAVTFYGAGEHVTLAHSAENRTIFARGAIQVGAWLHEQRKQKASGWFTLDQYFSPK